MTTLLSTELPPIIISAEDHQTLAEIAMLAAARKRQPAIAEVLAEELGRAEVVPKSSLPCDVVAMNSTVEYEDGVTDQVRRVTLVYPGEEEWDHNRVSVLSPIGAALIGLGEGQTMYWRTPLGGWRGLKVLRVLCPHRRLRAGGWSVA